MAAISMGLRLSLEALLSRFMASGSFCPLRRRDVEGSFFPPGHFVTTPRQASARRVAHHSQFLFGEPVERRAASRALGTTLPLRSRSASDSGAIGGGGLRCLLLPFCVLHPILLSGVAGLPRPGV